MRILLMLVACAMLPNFCSAGERPDNYFEAFLRQKPAALRESGQIMLQDCQALWLEAVGIPKPPTSIEDTKAIYRINVIDAGGTWRSFRVAFCDRGSIFAGVVEVVSRRGAGEFRFYPFTTLGSRNRLYGCERIGFSEDGTQLTFTFNVPTHTPSVQTATFDVMAKVFVDDDIARIEVGDHVFFPHHTSGLFQGLWEYRPDAQWVFHENLTPQHAYDDFARAANGQVNLHLRDSIEYLKTFDSTYEPVEPIEVVFDPRTRRFLE